MSAMMFLLSTPFLSLVGTENIQEFVQLLKLCLVSLVKSNTSKILGQNPGLKTYDF